MCLYTFVWRPDTNAFVSLDCSSQCFLRQGFSLYLEPTDLAGPLSSELLRSS